VYKALNAHTGTFVAVKELRLAPTGEDLPRINVYIDRYIDR